MSHFSRLPPFLARISNNSTLDPLILPWFIPFSEKRLGRADFWCVGLACSSWPWLLPASWLATYLLNTGVSYITLPTPFQLHPGYLLVMLPNVVIRHPCVAMKMLEVGRPCIILSFLFHLFLFFFFCLFFSLSLPMSVHPIVFFIIIIIIVLLGKRRPTSFCLEKLCISNIPMLLKSLQVFRSLGGEEAGMKRCLGDWWQASHGPCP